MKMLTTADKLLIAVFACIIIASFALVKASSDEGSVVLIQVDGTTVHKTSLRETHIIAVHGTHGQLTVEIREGRVAITQAQCPNHICVKTGWRSHSGEIIVCVPNNTVVLITASRENQVRATTG
jgi:hypothetical protein